MPRLKANGTDSPLRSRFGNGRRNRAVGVSDKSLLLRLELLHHRLELRLLA
jgi:hypothetical protein